jgi:hypothetical protein
MHPGSTLLLLFGAPAVGTGVGTLGAVTGSGSGVSANLGAGSGTLGRITGAATGALGGASVTVFTTPKNDVTTTLGSAYTAGSGSLVVASGTGVRFGSPSTGAPIRVTCIRASDGAYSILKVTGVASDTLTIASALEGTTDINLSVGDVVAIRVSAGYVTDAYAAINALESSSGGGVVAAGSTGQIQYNDNGALAASDKFVIDATSQHIGIGVTTPNATLDMADAAQVGNNAGDKLRLFNVQIAEASGNVDQFRIELARTVTGTDWTGCEHVFSRIVDGSSVAGFRLTGGTNSVIITGFGGVLGNLAAASVNVPDHSSVFPGISFGGYAETYIAAGYDRYSQGIATGQLTIRTQTGDLSFGTYGAAGFKFYTSQTTTIAYLKTSGEFDLTLNDVAAKGLVVTLASGTPTGAALDIRTNGGTSLASITAAGVFTGSGAGLTALDAGAIATGTLAVARLPAIPESQITGLAADLSARALIAAANSFTHGQTIAAATGEVGLTVQAANNADALDIKDSGGVTRSSFDKDGYGFPREYTFLIASGTPATVGNDKANRLIVMRDCKLAEVSTNARTGPTGAALILDVAKSTDGGSTFTSLWATTTANRPAIAAGATIGNQTAFDTTTLPKGTIIRIDVVQVGSTIAGQDITLQLLALTRNL